MSKKKSEPLFVTGASHLVDLVKKTKKISLKKASQELGINEFVIEAWAYDIEVFSGDLKILTKGKQKFLVKSKPD